MNDEILLRDATPADWPAILELNTAHVPAVSPLDTEGLRALVAWSKSVRVALLREQVVGFIILLGPGLPYQSLNYRWFTARYSDFVYVDRIALGAAAQRRGLGRRLYAEAHALAATDRRPMLCEVNIKPRNEASLAFHSALGFVSVGEQELSEGKRVVMLALAP